ncbi:MAG: hypothetical protein M0Q93_04720, partial [Terrimicrobiaceae bacterium]|nr:hypothetical protein [Terrimicrobiaceae bacterium]
EGLLAGRTQLRYLGGPVGLVEEVKASGGKVVATARLEPGHVFELNASPRKDWLRWAPAIPIPDRN